MTTQLAVRSSYSLLNGMMSIDQIVESSKEMGYGACVLSDLHVLHGALDFQVAAEKRGLKPIFGMECTFKFKDIQFNSNLIAKDEKGYQKLIEISLKLSKDGFIDLEEAFSNSLILVLFTENGPFEGVLAHEDTQGAFNIMKAIANIGFDMVLGVSHQESQYFKVMNKSLIDIATQLNIMSVACPKVYYYHQEDEEAFRVIQAISKQTYLEDKTLISSPNRHFLSKQEMIELYGEVLVSNTDAIASRCHLDLRKNTTHLPIYVTNQSVSNKVYLKELAQMGLKKRLKGHIEDVYQARLNHELEIINNLNFEDYFLIIFDVIRFAKRSGIYVGPGRGSAAGSLVAYVLGITEVDPITYDLLFERFLNPERVSMPDIDIDFPDDKRHLVLDYVIEKYGIEHVAHIATFGSLRARQAFRDVGRVLQIPVRTVDSISKLISSADLKTNYHENKRFKDKIDQSEDLQRAIKLAVKVEGLFRHASLHAAGVVMSQRPLSDFIPVMEMNETMRTVQYDMKHLESIGLIKMDFLGLRNLSIIANISSQVGNGFNIMDIPLDDKNTFDLIAKGETIGLFQLESEGMTKLLVSMKPKSFMDIVDTIALFRPGPMENIPMYLHNRSHPHEVQYLHDDLKEITESTYGILIYQEQIMIVAQRMAGFSLAKADILRKAMGSKNMSEMARLKEEFIQGCVSKGYEEKLAVELYLLVEKFASYGFNKSHSVAYGLISYQMAYLKANHSELFFTYLLDSVIGSDSKTSQYIEAARRQKIQLLPINIQVSLANYKIEETNIRLPFTIIKGISVKIALEIQSERALNGPYHNYYDAISRLHVIGINQSQFESLIDAGAFDTFNPSRLSMLGSLDGALRYTNIIKVEKDGQISLNRSLVSEPSMLQLRDSAAVALKKEYDALGFYYSEHPALTLRTRYKTDALIDTHIRFEDFRVIVMIDRIKLHTTKKGDPMAFLDVSDGSKSISIVVFPNLFKALEKPFETGQLLLIKGQMKEEDSLIAGKIHFMDEEKEVQDD